MNSIFRFGAAATILAAAVALCAPGPGAPALSVAEGSSQHYVVTNNSSDVSDNTGTVLKLDGTAKNPLLKSVYTLQTGVDNNGYGIGFPNVQILREGSEVCAFLADPDNQQNHITAFKYPGLTVVGNYSDPQIQYATTLSIAARGKYLFAAYTGDAPYLDTWQIGEGCALRLTQSLSSAPGIGAMSVAPNGKTLLVNYDSYGEVGSFSIAADGSLTEHGPYSGDGGNGEGGVDVTSDGKYAVFAIESIGQPPNYDDYTQIDVFPINSDGSLGKGYVFGGDGELGDGYGSGPIWLSPNETFLFASDIDNGSQQVTSLFFSENPIKVGYSCIISPRRLGQEILIGGFATALPSGSGGGLYLAEITPSGAALGLFSISSSTGCLTESPASPFQTGQVGELTSVAAWPPRPF